MKMFSRLMVMVVCGAFVNISNAAIIMNGAYTFNGSESTLDERINRNGVASEWGVNKAFPGAGFLGTFPLQLFGFNSGSLPFLQITFSGEGATDNVYAAIYDAGTFDADNIAAGAGFIADGGLSSGTPPSDVVFRFEGLADTNYDIVAYTLNSPAATFGVCVEGFESAVSPVPDACAIDFETQLTPLGDDSEPVPLPSTLLLVLAGVLLGQYKRIVSRRA